MANENLLASKKQIILDTRLFTARSLIVAALAARKAGVEIS